MMVMTFCLMVYNFSQYQLRAALKKNQETVPNQLKKEVQNPTVNWIYEMFQGIGVAYLDFKTGMQEIVTNLDTLLKRIIRYFGPYAFEIYGIPDG